MTESCLIAESPLFGHEVLSSNLDSCVLVPKYYDPHLADDVAALSSRYDTTTLRRLQQDEDVEIKAGHEVGKLAYGTGDIPFIRTSDVANWEIKADPKHSVSADVHKRYAVRQDIRPDDLLLVRDGTYLVGSIAMVTSDDIPMLYQSHILRIRVHASPCLSPHLLLGIWQTLIVQRQLRARQFTADIIDSLGNRYLDVVLPVPCNAAHRTRIQHGVRNALRSRAYCRDQLSEIRGYPLWGQSAVSGSPEAAGRTFWNGFAVDASRIDDNVLVPKYYDRRIQDAMNQLATINDFVSIGNLVEDGVIEWSTGCEVGKMAYGTGTIPFIRSSDLSNLEIRHDPKHRVSSEVWERFRASADLRTHDILFVRDGTYLIGQSAIIMESDLPSLFAGGLYRFRIIDNDRLDPFLLLAALQTDIVRQQIQARRFTRNIIDTIGKRIFGVKIPLPVSRDDREQVTSRIRLAIEQRAELRETIKGFSNFVFDE